MKVAFTLDPARTGGGGSYTFARLLAQRLPSHGISVSFRPWRRCDAVLVFANVGSPTLLRCQRWRGARVIHRLDERIDPGEDPARARKHAHLLRLNALAHVSIFQSRFVAANVGPHAQAPQSIVIHNGVDATRFDPSGPRRALEGAPKILHASWSIGGSKRLDRLSELLRALPPEGRVYLAGRQQEATGLALNDPRITCLGPLDAGDMAILMRSVDALFFPSEDDPCPNTILEAMASGLPALYHPSGGTVELIGGAGVPLSSDLRADLHDVAANRESLARHGRERVLAEFTAEQVVARYARVLKDALP